MGERLRNNYSVKNFFSQQVHSANLAGWGLQPQKRDRLIIKIRVRRPGSDNRRQFYLLFVWNIAYSFNQTLASFRPHFSGIFHRAAASGGCDPPAQDGDQWCPEHWALQCLHRGRGAVCHQQNPGGGLPHGPHPCSSNNRSDTPPVHG